jgi:hypothetical protein
MDLGWISASPNLRDNGEGLGAAGGFSNQQSALSSQPNSRVDLDYFGAGKVISEG